MIMYLPSVMMSPRSRPGAALGREGERKRGSRRKKDQSRSYCVVRSLCTCMLGRRVALRHYRHYRRAAGKMAGKVGCLRVPGVGYLAQLTQVGTQTARVGLPYPL